MKAGRNDPCPCGSGKKYKKCCWSKDKDAESSRLVDVVSASADPHPPGMPLPPLRSSHGGEPESFTPKPESRPEPPDPEREKWDAFWDRFDAADCEGRIATFLESLSDAESMAGGLAVEMLDPIHDDLAKRGERQRFADLVQMLRERLPDAYKDNDLHYLSLCLQDALVDGRRDAVPSLARQLALDGGRDIDLLRQAFDGLAYHGCLPVLVEAHRTAWPSVKDSTEVFEWAISDFANAAADCEILDYLEHTRSPDASDPALLDRVKFFVEEPRLEYLNEFIADLTGQAGREWTMDDFSLKRRKKSRDAGNANLPDVGADNLSRLIRQFVGYLRRDEGVSFATGAMVRPELFRYFLQRHDGELNPRLSMFDQMLHPHRKPPKPAPPIHPLCPERVTFDAYLGTLVAGFNDLFYRSAALFQAVPPWLRFLQSQRLIDEQIRGRVVHDLLPLHARILELFEAINSDPTVYQALRNWPEDAAKGLPAPVTS